MNAKQAWVNKIVPIAKMIGEHYKIDWRILAGIATHESDWGRALAAPFNCCGIKWTPTQWKLPGEPVKTKENQGTSGETTIRTRFASFFSFEHCLGYLAEMLVFSGHYELFRETVPRVGLYEMVVERALYLIQQCGYATDVNYSDKVMVRVRQIEAIAREVDDLVAGALSNDVDA